MEAIALILALAFIYGCVGVCVYGAKVLRKEDSDARSAALRWPVTMYTWPMRANARFYGGIGKRVGVIPRSRKEHAEKLRELERGAKPPRTSASEQAGAAAPLEIPDYEPIGPDTDA